MKCSYKLTPEQEAVVQKALKEGKEKYKSIEHIIIESNIDSSGIFEYMDGDKHFHELTLREKELLADVAKFRAEEKNQDLLEDVRRVYPEDEE